MADTATHTIERTMNNTTSVYAVVSTPDDRFIFVVSRNAIIKTDRRTGQEVKRKDSAHGGLILRALAIDGLIIVSCSIGDRIVKVWNMDLELQQSLEGHLANVFCVAISPDSTMIVSGDQGGR